MSTLKDEHSGTVHTLKDLEANVTEMLAEWDQGRPEAALDSAAWSAGLLLQAVKRLRELEAKPEPAEGNACMPNTTTDMPKPA